MTGDQTVQGDAKEFTRRAKDILGEDSRFEVNHAYRLVDVDEQERVPNCLAVDYLEREFFIYFRGDGRCRVERAGPTNTQIGEMDATSHPAILCDQLAAILDRDSSPPVVVTADGDQVVPRAGTADDDPLPSDLRHAVCGYRMEGHQTTEKLRAYHCQGCGLRVVVPVTVKTWGDLRRWSDRRHADDVLDYLRGAL